MREAEIRQARAYVLLDSALVKFAQPNVPEAQVHFRNSGQTPAYNLRGWIGTAFGQFPLNKPLLPPPTNLAQGVETLAPNRKTIFIAPTGVPLTPELMAMLGTPKYTFYVFGELRYTDVFGIERVTKYRLMHGGPRGARSVPSKDGGTEHWLLKPDTEGNEAD